MKKTYIPISDEQQIVEDLLAAGVKVTAGNWKISRIEIDTVQHNIADIETVTGLKFREVVK